MDAYDFIGLLLVVVVGAAILGAFALILKWMAVAFMFLWAL